MGITRKERKEGRKKGSSGRCQIDTFRSGKDRIEPGKGIDRDILLGEERGSGNQAKKQDGNERPGRGKDRERTPEL